MASGTEIPLDHVAKLARLELTDEQRERFAQQLGDVLSHVARLQAVDTTGVEAIAHARPLSNVWREDEPREGLKREAALQAAPAQHEGMVSVPRVVGES